LIDGIGQLFSDCKKKSSNKQQQPQLKEYITNGKPWWEDECVRDKPPSKVLPLYMIDKVASGKSHTFKSESLS